MVDRCQLYIFSSAIKLAAVERTPRRFKVNVNPSALALLTLRCDILATGHVKTCLVLIHSIGRIDPIDLNALRCNVALNVDTCLIVSLARYFKQLSAAMYCQSRLHRGN